MKYKGVVFDFNGTLFWDTKLHNIAWDEFLTKHKIEMTDDEKFRKLHGKNNRDILKGMFGEDLSEEKLVEYILEKEFMYFDLCITHNFSSLAPGVEDFFLFLKQNNIPFTIATASGIENIEFYFKHLDLAKWFDREKIIYNNGKIKGKPHPEVYLKAMETIGVDPAETIVFEDAVAGLQSARNAGAGRIIVVNSNGDDYSEWSDCQIIRHYDEVDRNIFV